MDILLFTGYSATGKSTLAKKLSEHLGYEFISVRPLLHKIAEDKGYSRIRQWLAEEGAENLVQATKTELVRTITERQKLPGAIIDDAFDRGLESIIKSAFPTDTVLVVALTLDENTREIRMSNRIGRSVDEAREELRLFDGFKMEAGIDEVISSADLTIDNLDDPEITLQTLVSQMEGRGSPGGKERLI